MASSVKATEEGPAPPPPKEPLEYPICFVKIKSAADDIDSPESLCEDDESGSVTLFNALRWLLPVYELAGWIAPAPQRGEATPHNNNSNNNNNNEDDDGHPFADVKDTLALLPRFQEFFEIQSNLIPQHAELYYVVQSLAFPTPRGPRTVTRAKVEGDHRAVHSSVRSLTTVTNSTACFSLLPGHNHFLLNYEPRQKLKALNYLQLDQLRFAWVAVRELIAEGKVFHRHDGALTGLARRDLKKNNPREAPERNGNAEKPTKNGRPDKEDNSDRKAAAAAGGGVGRGGGNARLHQGTSGNVLVGPSAAAVEGRRAMQQKRFLKGELEAVCGQRWPHTPPHKSCLFSVEETHEAELSPEALRAAGLLASNVVNRAGGKRKGPKLYRATVELPLLNKKGPAARFTAERWWLNRADAESAVAEVALLALRSMKSNA